MNKSLNKFNKYFAAISNNLRYICNETLAESLELVEHIDASEGVAVEVDDEIKTLININKLTNEELNQEIEDYRYGVDALYQAEQFKNTMRNWEHDVWNY